MVKYKVIHPFKDLQEKMKSQPEGRLYHAGDDYPATKRVVNEERVAELLGEDNLIGKPIIEIVEDIDEESD